MTTTRESTELVCPSFCAKLLRHTFERIETTIAVPVRVDPPEQMTKDIQGKWTTEFRHGCKSAEGEVQDCTKVGLWRTWFTNGRVEAEGHSQRGIKHGIWKTWHRNGQRFGEVELMYGRLHGRCRYWHSNSQKLGEVTFDHGIRQGPCQYGNSDGSLDTEKSGLYASGRKIVEPAPESQSS